MKDHLDQKEFGVPTKMAEQCGKTMLRHTILAQGPTASPEWHNMNKTLAQLNFENKQMRCLFKKDGNKPFY